MSLLLDTSTLIWFLAGDKTLSRKAKTAIESPDAEIVVSAVSGYEIELKRRLGKRMPALPADLGPPLRAAGFRLLIAQAHLEKLPIATSDPVFAAFGCEVVW